jgi:uncharacterized protein DUF3105
MIAVGALAVVVIVVAVIVAVVLTGGGSSNPSSSSNLDVGQQIIPAAPSGPTTTEQTPKRVPNRSGIPGVMAWDTEGWPGNGEPHPGALEHDHVSGPVKYAVTPPVGGPHNAIWMNAGVYTEPIPSERAVHNLEHGAVWITYRPSLPASQVDALVGFVARQSLIPEQEDNNPGQENRYMDLSPWSSDDLPAPIVISSWGFQLRVSSPSDPRLQKFVDTFRNSSNYTPEYGSQVDGVPVETGGRPAAYGSKDPNPPGVVQQ